MKSRGLYHLFFLVLIFLYSCEDGGISIDPTTLSEMSYKELNEQFGSLEGACDCSELTINRDDCEKNWKGERVEGTCQRQLSGKVFKGICETRHGNGNLEYLWTYGEDGKSYGYSLWFFENGKIRDIGYQSGKYEKKNGTVFYGDYLSFFEDGSLRLKNEFDMNGTKDGEFVEYYSKDVLKSIDVYESGVIELSESYYSDGSPMFIYDYKEKTFKNWYPDSGHIRREESSTQIICYHENGKKMIEIRGSELTEKGMNESDLSFYRENANVFEVKGWNSEGNELYVSPEWNGFGFSQKSGVDDLVPIKFYEGVWAGTVDGKNFILKSQWTNDGIVGELIENGISKTLTGKMVRQSSGHGRYWDNLVLTDSDNVTYTLITPQENEGVIWEKIINTDRGGIVGRFRLDKESNSDNEHVEESSEVGSTNDLYQISDPDGYSNMRKTPGGKVLKKVYEGEYFEVLGEEDVHKKVKLSDGTVGYIHSSRVIKN
ncbi:MAG: hypothetical protein WDZ35_07305 [Crocinitomicaceae bacterium]